MIALISLPSAITSGNLTIIVAWISSNFIQLVLLPIIIVGQNVQAKAADKRSEQTYKDAEAVLAEALKIQEHLAAQDKALEEHRANLAQPGRGSAPACPGTGGQEGGIAGRRLTGSRSRCSLWQDRYG